jgi:hypothetical protein
MTGSDDTVKQLRYLAAALKAPRITVNRTGFSGGRVLPAAAAAGG